MPGAGSACTLVDSQGVWGQPHITTLHPQYPPLQHPHPGVGGGGGGGGAHTTSTATDDEDEDYHSSGSDGRDLQTYQHNKAWKKHMRRNAKTNRHTELNQHFIPRTDRAPKDRNLAEKEPKKFAQMLTERLLKVKEDQEKLERMHESLHTIETDEETMDSSRASIPSQKPANTSMGNLPFQTLFASAIAEKDKEDDNAQSILEEHVSRIWDSSNGQTPSRSPGRHSPTRAGHSPERGPIRPMRGAVPFPTPNTSSSLLCPPAGGGKVHHHRRKDKDGAPALLSNSYDSGMGVDERTGVYYEGEVSHHKHIYHYHHHHHHINPNANNPSGTSSKDLGSKCRLQPGQAPQQDHDTSALGGRLSRSMQHYPSAPSMPQRTADMYREDAAAHRSRSKEAKRAAKDAGKPLKRGADSASSNMDSGVSLHYSSDHIHHPAGLVPNIHDPANEKVMAWMMENEKMATGNTQYSTDGSDRGSSSHKRSSHKSTSSQSAHKSSTSGSKKQPVPYSTSRSGSLDRSGHHYPTQPGLPGQDYPATPAGLPLASYSLQGLTPGGGAVPSQPIVQDPSMPLLPSPNPMTQLEEAKRRLEDESHRHMLKSRSFTGMSSSSSTSKDRRAMPPPMLPSRSTLPGGSSASSSQNTSKNIPQVAPLDLSSSEEYSSSSQKSDKRSSSRKTAVGGNSSHSLPSTPSASTLAATSASSGAPVGASGAPESTTVAYYLGTEPIPYRSSLPGRHITLAQFKQLIGKRGNYRYFFKKADNEFDSGCVHEEFFDDAAILPIWEGKIVGKVEKVE